MAVTAMDALARTSRLINDQFFAGAAKDAEICDALPRLKVVVSANGANAETENGQQLITNLALLIARMGIRVELDFPDVPLLVGRPLLQHDDLVSALIEFGQDLVPGAGITTRQAGSSCLHFVIGDSPVPSTGKAVRISGDEWSLELTDAHEDTGHPWGGGLSFGAFAAAATGAAEALRAALTPLSELMRVPLRAQAHRLQVGIAITLDLRSTSLSFWRKRPR